MAHLPPLRVAVVGLGQVAAQRHLPVLASHPHFQVAALADIDLARARQVGAQYGVERVFADARAVTGRQDVDAVAICTPPATHAALVHAALDAGKHVFVEKPLTLDVAQAQALRAHAERAAGRVLVGFNLRHHSRAQLARRELRAGRIGALRAVHTTWTNPPPGDLPEWRRDPLRGGSLLFDLGVHHFDLCRYLCEQELEDVRAQQSSSGQTVTLQARLGSHILMTGLIGGDAFEQNIVELVGERGRMLLSLYHFDTPLIYPRDAYDGGLRLRLEHARVAARALPRALAERRHGGVFASSYRAEWDHFYRVARHGAEPLANLDDGLAATRAACCALASLSQSRGACHGATRAEENTFA